MCDTYLFNLFISYKSEKIKLIQSFKNHIIHISMQKVATILQFVSYKSFHVRLSLEILQNHSQKQPLEVFHKKFFSNILRHLQENTCVGVSFFNKVAGHQSCNFIKTWISVVESIYQFTITPNLKNICKQLHWKVFCNKIFQIRT